ncbi:MAG: hypothetical protein R6T93_09290 [Trueperaceae bacterium]
MVRTLHGTVIVASAVVALLLTTFVSAQADDRALHLLEGMQRADPWAGETIETIEMVMVMVSHGAPAFESRTRTVVDYVGRRALIVSDLGDGTVTVVRVVDGQVSMSVAGEEIALPPGMAALYDAVFDAPATDLDPAASDARYDGMRAYGDLVEGEQVTVRGAALLPAGFDASITAFGPETEAALLFDAEGRLIATVVETVEGKLLGLVDDPDETATLGWSSWTGYWLRPDGPELAMTVRYETVRVNEPIADGTF